ncbi:MAG: hypothetical protein OXT69_03970 [Candidatus Poribacteria bacterium]|nr:hypothetical protein [Candidatus Poribacteria bacterium]
MKRTLYIKTLILVPLLLAGGIGCGSSGLGPLEETDVTAAIQEAQAHIDSARSPDMDIYAQAALAEAQTNLAEARRYLAEKNGVEALRFAHKASAQAQRIAALDAQSDALKRFAAEEEKRRQEALNELEAARLEAEQARGAIRTIQTEIETLGLELGNLQRQAEEARQRELDAQERALALEALLETAKSELAIKEARIKAANDRASESDALKAEMNRQLQQARKAAELAEAKAQAARKEAEREKTEARRLAEAYSKAAAGAQRQAQREAAIAKAKERTRPKPSELTDAQMQAAQRAVSQWKRAWERRDAKTHAAYYAPSLKAYRVDVKEGSENRAETPRTQFMKRVSDADPSAWTPVGKAALRGEGKQAVSELSYRRKSSSPDAPDYWVRKSYWSSMAASWRIVKEEWRFYEAAPTFEEK